MAASSPRARDHDEPPFPWVSATIMATAAVVHALKLYTLVRWPPKTSEAMLDLVLDFGALYAPAMRDGEPWRAITYAFQHGAEPTLSVGGSFMHLGFNLLSVRGLGVSLERRIGSVAFLQLSVVGCLGAAAVVLALAPARVVTMGASGVIFGWAAAALFLVRRSSLFEFGSVLLLNLALSLMPGISWQGHLGGFLFGVPCGLVLRRSPGAFSTRAPLFAALACLLGTWALRR
jgi:rhomboid protease GluP